ncbi:MAG TPA: hypothetical protein VIG49_05630, partial [Acetobacteraceae bacterium]
MSSASAAVRDNDAGAAAGGGKRGRKKLVLLAMPVLLAALLAGLWFSDILPHALGLDHARNAAAAKPVPPSYVDLPEMVANLNGNPRHPSYVKLVAR